MKLIILTLFGILLSSQVQGQGYKTVVIEKKNIDSDNLIYRPGLQFIYNLTILNDDDTLFLKMNIDRSFELLRAKTNETVSRVLMTVAKPKNKDRTNKKQTEIFYSYENLKYLASSTGIVENDMNIWLHPPRDSFFGILELFPFPYIKLENQMKHKWADQLSLNEKWSNELIGSWEGELETELTYEITDNVGLESSFGEVKCQQIRAQSKSVLGDNILIAYFSEEYGFMKLEYVSYNNLRLNFELETVKEVGIYTSLEDFLLEKK